MGCTTVPLEGGFAIVCSRGAKPRAKPCKWCTDLSAFLCDHVVDTRPGQAMGKTCDAPMCRAHAKQIGRDRHACPDHFVPRQRELL